MKEYLETNMQPFNHSFMLKIKGTTYEQQLLHKPSRCS